MIFRAGKMYYEELEEIWERSVRATHNILTEKKSLLFLLISVLTVGR